MPSKAQHFDSFHKRRRKGRSGHTWGRILGKRGTASRETGTPLRFVNYRHLGRMIMRFTHSRCTD